MNANYKDLKKDETSIFSADCGYDASRHVLNLSNRDVPQSLLDAVENGCTIETLDELSKEFPICKYRTQITIHGRFPALSTNRIGGYVNLVRNQNKSVGVRWNAIDHMKKSRLYRRLAVYGGFRVHESSSEFYAYKMIPVTKENYAEIYGQLKAQAAAVDRSLFYGTVSAFLASACGCVFACLEIRVNAFYKRNFRAIVHSVTGLTDEQMAERTRSYLDQKRHARKLLEERLAQFRAEAAERKQKRAEMEAAWLAANPCPFEMVKGYTLNVGDVFAELNLGGSWDNYAPKGWNFYVVKKSFGRLTAQPCDVNGEKLMGLDRYRKGHEIKKPTGNYRVRRCA